MIGGGRKTKKRAARDDAHVAHRRYSFQDPLHARLRPIYSTSVVSNPNQTAFEIFRKVGTVSNTVTTADMMIEDVVYMCMAKADREEVGCSRRA